MDIGTKSFKRMPPNVYVYVYVYVYVCVCVCVSPNMFMMAQGSIFTYYSNEWGFKGKFE